MTKIKLPCGGGGPTEHKIPKKADTITFVPDGTCTLTDVTFTKNAGAFKKQSGAGFTYDYDGSGIPDTGAEFSFITDAMKGNGSGVIKNP